MSGAYKVVLGRVLSKQAASLNFVGTEVVLVHQSAKPHALIASKTKGGFLTVQFDIKSLQIRFPGKATRDSQTRKGRFIPSGAASMHL